MSMQSTDMVRFDHAAALVSFNYDHAAAVTAAISLLKAEGYRLSKPRDTRKTVERPAFNCLGLPMSASYDPTWKRKTPLTSIARLYAPNRFPFVQCNTNGTPV